MFGLALALGLQYTLPQADDVVVESYSSVYVQLSGQKSPFYLWGALSANETTVVLGQKMHRANNPSVGLGYTVGLTPKVSGFIEGGYKFRDGDYVDFARKEIAYTYLVGRHNVYNRPVPVTLNGVYDQESYQSTFEIGDSILFSAGVEVAVTEALVLRVGYTVERADILWEIYDQDQKDLWIDSGGTDGGYWMEDDVLRGDGFTFSVQYSF